ncbi:MAG TPA: hypothetical protein VL528_01705 [Oxalicibacterium sp.]|nr:hypothetical protein [Oxalicibacterium sp.]
MNKPSTDLGIPLLTEVISAPAAETEPVQAQPAEALMPSTLDARALPIAGPDASIDGWMDEEWTRVEQKVRERVLAQLLERVDTMIDQRIREGVADVLQSAVTRLVDDLRLGLHQTLDDLIADAVTQEIERTRFTRN